jgi:anti-sigma factor RsiW
MTSNFDARKFSRQEASREMDSLQRDRFELLSAYIDGEATAAERKQVQELLVTDSEMQRLHARLLKLRKEIQKIPVPQAETTAQQTAQEVFARIDRRRIRRTVLWGGAAIAAVFVSAFSGIFPGSQSPLWQQAILPKQEAAPEPLMIALDRPVIEISKAAVASPEQFIERPAVHRSADKNDFN